MTNPGRDAVRAALRLRQRLNIAATDPVCPIDAAERMGVEVRYVAVASLEGLYIGGQVPTIFVAADRPRGRQAMTVAHELVHHVNGDGTALHAYLEGYHEHSEHSVAERAANQTAAHFLMSRSAVLSGFKLRGFDPRQPTPEQVLAIAGWLGVGYTSLIVQLSAGLGFLSSSRSRELQKEPLPKVRTALLESINVVPGDGWNSDAIVVDRSWRGRPVDLRVGDVAVIPSGFSLRGTAATALSRRLLGASHPGVSQLILADSGESHFIRVMRRTYAGLARFRHLESLDDD